MRRYAVLMALGLLWMLIGFQLSASPATAPPIEAEVNIHPEVFNLEQKGVITAHISDLEKKGVPQDVKDINVSTIKLYHEGNFVAEPVRSTVEGNIIIVKFDATVVADYVWGVVYHMGIVPPIRPQEDYTMTFTVLGKLFNGEQFEGSDTMKIVIPKSAP